MPNLLGRELTDEESKVEAALRHALFVLDKRSSLSSIRAIAAKSPEDFLAAALFMLESKPDRGGPEPDLLGPDGVFGVSSPLDSVSPIRSVAPLGSVPGPQTNRRFAGRSSGPTGARTASNCI